MLRKSAVRIVLAVALIPAPSCTPVRSVVHSLTTGRWQRVAESVTIYRDDWGVPHLYGPTDASVVFGMAWAQAEDNFWQVEEDFIQSIGRAASLYGEAGLENDLVRAAFEVERLSRDELAREEPEMRALWTAFAEGLNYYLRMHPAVQPRLIKRFEPWFVLARFRNVAPGMSIDGVRLGGMTQTPVDPGATAFYQMVGRIDTAAAGEPSTPDRGGSNAWAVAPARTRDGHALLFQNPHVGFFGGGQRYEVQLQSGEGWHFSGFAVLGTPVPRAGHNEVLGWTHTNTAADHQDAWLLTFDDPTNPLAYRHGDGWREATPFEATIDVRTDAGVVKRTFRFLRTHLGPVVAMDGGHAAVVKIARFEEGGALRQWYAMGRARSLEEFMAALGGGAFPISNTMYADRDGHILYVHGNAVPRRSVRFDWTRPVDGADPDADWKGYHTLEELPHLLDPPGGWLQNTNSTPFLATADGSNLDAKDYPAYMAPEPDNARARSSRRILEGVDSWTFDAFAAAAFDTRLADTGEDIRSIIDEWERLGAYDPDRAAKLDPAIDELRGWDGVATVESSATTLFLRWKQRMRAPPVAADDRWARLTALEGVVAQLQADWGRQSVAWGEMNRLQRVHTSGREPFDDAAASLPVPGAPGWAGPIFAFSTRPGPSGRIHYGVSGDTWVSIVELAADPRARSIVTFGQSADPASQHWFDQAPLYARGQLRDAWFRRDDVEAHASASYHPGER